MSMMCFIFWFAVSFSVHRDCNPFFKTSLQVGEKKKIARPKVQRDICSSRFRLLWLEGDGGFEFLQIPLLPGRDGQAWRENDIST